MIAERTQVGIIGAGPAGLLLANILHQAGVACVVLEQREREYVDNRQRGATVDHRTVEILSRFGLAGNLVRAGKREDAIEFRANGRRHALRYSAVIPGCTHYIYPQQLLVRDLVDSYQARGGEIHFGITAVALEDLESATPRITARSPTGTQTLVCDVIAGCDGDHGIAARSIPARVLRRAEQFEQCAWLAVTADAPPSADCVVTALHERGSALHVRRTRTATRFYLQIAGDDRPEDWPEARVWSELRHRLVARDRPLHEGPITSTAIVPLRSMVHEPLRYGRLLLAGDAAHIVPPVGGKGLNLAVADADDLASALIRFFDGDESELDAYSSRRLQEAWRWLEFVHWMMGLVNTPATPFLHRLQLARLERVFSCSPYAEAFLAAYLGVEPSPVQEPPPLAMV